MPKAKIAITLDVEMLARVDELVREGTFANRSQAMEVAVGEKLARLQQTRLAQECARLDPERERGLAEEGLATDADEWPPY